MVRILCYDPDIKAWVKIADYNAETANKAINDPEYKKALIRAGFPENIELKAMEV